MVMDKTNLTEELRDTLVPEAAGNREAIDRDEDFPNLSREGREPRRSPDKVSTSIETALEEGFLHLRHAELHLELDDSGTNQLEGIGLSDRTVGVIGGGISSAIGDKASFACGGFGVINPLGFNDVGDGFVIREIGDRQTFDERVVGREG